MRRILVLFAALGLCSFALTGAADAQPTLGEVVEAVERDGYYLEPGADADVSGFRSLIADTSRFVVVVLAADDPDGADFAAGQVLDELSEPATVLVISPGEIGAVSDEFSDDDLDRAIDEALDVLDSGADVASGARAFAQSLGLVDGDVVAPTPDAGPTSTTSDENGSSGSGWVGLLVLLAVVAAVVGGLFWFANRRAKKVDGGEVEAARAEIRSQLEAVAHDIVEHEAAVDLSGNEAAIGYFREASATYTDVSAAVDVTTNLLELAELNDEIDLARWQLEAAEALLDGRPLPPKPEPDKPVACFFDPTHRPGVEECTIKTSAGNKQVRVCERCAAKLEKGERPEPRMIEVGGKRVPAAKAPRSHGGLGMGGLSIFEVILGGLGALTAARQASTRRPTPSRGGSVDLDWGDMLPKRRRSGDVFGQDRQPPRPRGLPRTSASRRPRSSSSRRRSSGASKRGSARRRRG